MAYIKDSTTDIATTVSEPSFVGGQASIEDYPFQTRGFGLGMAQLSSTSPFYSGDYSETNLFESLIPIRLNLLGGGGFGGGGYQRFARPILLRKDDHYIPTPTAVGLANPPIHFQDDQLVEFNSDNYFQLNPTEVVELNSHFTISAGGTGYPGSQAFTNVATTGGTGVGITVDIQVSGAGVITSATVNDEGFGYTHGDTIKIIHPTDPSHVGKVLSFDPASLAGGVGYTTGTALATTGGSGSASLTVNITASGGAITNVTINDGGTGYLAGETITIVQAGGSGGTIDIATVGTQATLTLNRDKFTVIMRDLTNTKLTLKYENIDQFAFVEGTNLGDEPNGTQSVSDIVFLKSRTDGTDNVASLAIADGGSGYPNGGGGGVGFSTTTTGGSGAGLGVSVSTSGAGVINFVQSPPPAGTQGAGYRNGDIVNVVNPNGGANNATLTVTTTRHSQVADITITDGVVTGLAVSNVGTGLATGDLLEATLGNGGKVKFRYLKSTTEYHNFTAAIIVQINTAAGHGFEVGDYMVVDHDNPATQVLGVPGNPSSKKEKGEYTWVDEDAVYFFHRNIPNTDWSFGIVTTPVNDRSKLVTTVGTGPAALAASDKINENQMSIGATLGTLAQRLNPKFKAVKMTCASAWAIEPPDTAPAVTLVAANAEHIFRYYGSNDGLFKARTQGGGSATLNWQYFVG